MEQEQRSEDWSPIITKRELINLSNQITVYILKRGKNPKKIKVNGEKSFFIYGKGLYNISSDLIHLDPKDNPTLYYFENMPTALNMAQKNSGYNYLDERIAANHLEQLVPNVSSGSGFSDLIAFIVSEPRNLIFIILVAVVLWAIVTSGGI